MNILSIRLIGDAQRVGTMRQETFSAPGVTLRQTRTAPQVSGRRHSLTIAVLLSITVHLSAALLILFHPLVLPNEPQPREQGTVELLMVEQKGTEKAQPAEPPADEPPIEPKKTEALQSNNETPASVPQTVPAPPQPEDHNLPSAPLAAQPPSTASASDAQSNAEQKETRPVQPASRQAPVFNLDGTDSDSNAIAMGSQILPAMPDNRFRNRPPAYPAEAERRRQHGAVVVVIHVSENGVATRADVMESSGFAILDQAAVSAVLKWHFHPAMKAGSTVPFDMPFRFIFEGGFKFRSEHPRFDRID